MFQPEQLLRPIRDALRRRIEIREVRRELRSHIEMRIQDNIDDGLSPAAARDKAYQRFGNFLCVQQKCIEIKKPRAEAIMGAFLSDLRYGGRMLVRRPGFTIVAVLTLAIGIGVNSAIFSVVNAVLLNPLPYKDADRLVQFWETNPIKGWNGDTNPVAPANFLDWQKQNKSFAEMAAYNGVDGRGVNSSDIYLTSNGSAERLQGLGVTSNIFSVLGVQPAIGRAFLPEENWVGKSDVVILSNRLWQSRFGSDPSIIGKTIVLSGANTTVIGVMPVGFYFPTRDIDLWAPMGWDPAQIAQFRRPHFLRVVARLNPGISVDQARSEMTGIASALEQQYAATNKKMGVGLALMRNWEVQDARLALFVFLAAVAFILLIACANVANLLLARSATRSKEFALRSALGAGRWRLVRQLLTESLLLSCLSGVTGLILATILNRVIINFSPGNVPHLDEVKLDGRVIVFTLIITFLTAVIFGLVPALTGSRTDLNEALKDAGQKGGQNVRGSRVRNLLVITEIALSLVLIIGAGLMIKSFRQLQRVNPGFDTTNLLTLTSTLASSRYTKSSQSIAFYKQVLERIKSLPGVTSATTVSELPLTGARWTSDFTIEGRAPEDYGKEVRRVAIGLDYLQTLKIPFKAGREFAEADDRTSQPVIIISDALARRHFSDEDPIGKHLKFSKPEIDGTWYTIVGVVGDVKQEGLSNEAKPMIYIPYLQFPIPSMNLVIRTTSDAHNLISAVRGEFKALDPEVPPYDVKTMDEVLDTSVSKQRFTTFLLTIFASVGLLLAAVGIYGVMSYTVTQRTSEIGIRMALGAKQSVVLTMVMGQGLKLVVIGLAIGLAVALALTRLMMTLLYGVSSTDPTTFISISALLAGVALFACYIPARRATKIDPMRALQYE